MQEKEIIENLDSMQEAQDVVNKIFNENAEVVDDTKEDSTEKGNNEIGNLETELAEQKDKFIRLMAEFENYKRRTSKERIELIQTAGKDIIVSMLDVLDDVDRAEKQLNNSEDLSVQKEGIQLVFNKIKTNLFSKGLKAMESINTEFDVEKHEAITEVPASNDEMRGKVLDEVQKGYFLNDKIIRFAKVVVAS